MYDTHGNSHPFRLYFAIVHITKQMCKERNCYIGHQGPVGPLSVSRQQFLGRVQGSSLTP